MATAVAYDDWEDPGMAFSEEELLAFDPCAWMATHLRTLADEMVMWQRRTELPDMPKPWMAREILVRMVRTMSWSASTACGKPLEEVVGWQNHTDIVLPDPTSKEGKALSQRALNCDAEAWLGERRAHVEGDLRIVVTTMRRRFGIKKPAKAVRSAGNKFVNCLVRELNLLDTLKKELDKQPKSRTEKEANASEASE